MTSSLQEPQTLPNAPNTNTLIALCKLLNILLVEDKREGQTTLLEYVGIL